MSAKSETGRRNENGELPADTKYALVSVSDKTGITGLGQALADAGYGIISTGGTAGALTEGGIPVIPISEVTGNPESFGGRMKTISFPVEGGILFNRDNPEHVAEARVLGVPQIDVVVCNLYPFAETVAKEGISSAEAIEQIDVGGPTMVRAAAKNFRHVLVVTDPSDYPEVAGRLKDNRLDQTFRQMLAARAFRHLSFYDAQIARYLSQEPFPEELVLPLARNTELRYGDNPDQTAVLYLVPGEKTPFSSLTRLSGREPSATNLTDIDAGCNSVGLFSQPAAVVIKHNTPCGIALGETAAEALVRALEADSESAFGGVVVLNVPLTSEAALVIAGFKEAGKGQMDIIAAPGFEEKAVVSLQTVRKTTGLYSFSPETADRGRRLIRMIGGGAVVQSVNNPEAGFANWQVVTKVRPTGVQLKLMQFAWKAIARIRSNTVAVIDGTVPMTRGIGSGQTSRVLATRIALERAGKFAQGAILASDSFFPFADSVELAAGAGISAIVQQGGSIRDVDSVKAADEAGIAMVLTGQRVFWH